MTDTVALPVRKGGEVVADAIVDAANAEWLGAIRWSLNSSGYVMGAPGLIHRVILGLTKGDGREVDHENRDKLDNRRANLRLSTRTLNLKNSDRADAAAARQAEIRGLFDEGLSRTEIAERLSVGYATVVVALKGKPRRDTMIWTPERIVAAIVRFHEETGRIPRNVDLNGQEGLPWFTTVHSRFGGIDAAVAAAGLTPRNYAKRNRSLSEESVAIPVGAGHSGSPSDRNEEAAGFSLSDCEQLAWDVAA